MREWKSIVASGILVLGGTAAEVRAGPDSPLLLPPPPPADLAGLALAPGFAAADGRIRCERDGAEVVLVPAGEFTAGSDRASREVLPVRRVFLPGFLMDRTEVTVGQFRRFCAEARREVPPQPAGSTDLHPVVAVTFGDAEAYARWAGRRLPTEEEWEKAARGVDGRRFPWGNADDRLHRNGLDSREDHGGLDPVGSHPGGASPFGCLDMAGNVWEWCTGTPDEKDAAKGPYGPCESGGHFLRGGAWCSILSRMECACRRVECRSDSEEIFGFRCAADIAWDGAPGREVLRLAAKGTKTYRCVDAGDGKAQWALLRCRADLFGSGGEKVGVHTRGESTPPAWQVGADCVSGTKVHERPSPRPGAIPEVQLLARPTGGVFEGVVFIERRNTTGGSPTAPAASAKIGEVVEVPYTADYLFLAPAR